MQKQKGSGTKKHGRNIRKYGKAICETRLTESKEHRGCGPTAKYNRLHEADHKYEAQIPAEKITRFWPSRCDVSNAWNFHPVPEKPTKTVRLVGSVQTKVPFYVHANQPA